MLQWCHIDRWTGSFCYIGCEGKFHPGNYTVSWLPLPNLWHKMSRRSKIEATLNVEDTKCDGWGSVTLLPIIDVLLDAEHSSHLSSVICVQLLIVLFSKAGPEERFQHRARILNAAEHLSICFRIIVTTPFWFHYFQTSTEYTFFLYTGLLSLPFVLAMQIQALNMISYASLACFSFAAWSNIISFQNLIHSQ